LCLQALHPQHIRLPIFVFAKQKGLIAMDIQDQAFKDKVQGVQVGHQTQYCYRAILKYTELYQAYMRGCSLKAPVKRACHFVAAIRILNTRDP
jgi:hypothetical protein